MSSLHSFFLQWARTSAYYILLTTLTTSVPNENDCLHKSNSGSAERYKEVVTAGTEVQKMATEGNSFNKHIDLHKDSI